MADQEITNTEQTNPLPLTALSTALSGADSFGGATESPLLGADQSALFHEALKQEGPAPWHILLWTRTRSPLP